MSQRTSFSAKRKYGLARVCRVLELPRSTFYNTRKRLDEQRVLKKRGPKPLYSDEELTEEIRLVLLESPFCNEGYRKAHARLKNKGIHTSKQRVLRLMREANLLAVCKRVHQGKRVHDGTIIPEGPNQMWGIDMTTTLTTDSGQVSIFVAVDHFTAECVGIHVAKRGTRFEALEPVRQGMRNYFGGYDKEVGMGLKMRHDHGSVFVSELFQEELRFLGVESSPAFVRQPETNGCVERFIRTLKEQVLWVNYFRGVEEMDKALQKFKKDYNEKWLIQRHGHISPAQARLRSESLQLAA